MSKIMFNDFEIGSSACFPDNQNVSNECGSKHEYFDSDAPKTIVSDELICFSFIDRSVNLSCKLGDDGLSVLATGGNCQRRDGTRFILKYNSCTLSLLEKLDQIIKKFDLAKNNGYRCHVDGLPAGCGDSLSADYKSGEKLRLYSNQCPTVRPDAAKAIYDAFHEDALRNGYDFTTAGSNMKIYDDADCEFLQGKWKGTHFGSEIIALFSDSTVKIFVDGKMTDNTEYTIFEGKVRTNKLRQGVTKAQSEHDYEEFEGCSCFAKKNDIFITAYFMKGSYSTCDLLRQKEG